MRYSALLFVALITGTLVGQPLVDSSWTFNAVNEYRVVAGITYSTASNVESKLDVYVRRTAPASAPTLVYFHGGGWVTGSKEGVQMNLLPYLEWGFNIVNVEYRLTKVAPAPAAVQDCRLALRWVFKNAATYGFDTTRIVLSGGSAGGHLALITGMLDPSAGIDLPTDWDYTDVQPKAAAIVNWFGITDVAELLSGPNTQRYAVYWLANQPNKEAIAKSVSPIQCARKGLPPVLTIHGDADPLVPYQQAVRFHDALKKANVPNKLVTIPGGKHGGFTAQQMTMIYRTVFTFLKEQGIIR
ncbi:MAG: alpha/beta hydrolase [Bacteroidetes bacterium]|nr:alpha/beta hydrolase [Bacteroidota bacterium]